MTTATFGQITVSGTPADIAIATEAFAGQRFGISVGDLQPRAYRMEFHTKAEFLSRGLVIPGTEGKRPKSIANPKGGIAAYGYTLPAAEWVSSSRSHDEQVYVSRHEPIHPIVAAHMTMAKKVKLEALVVRVAGTAYQNRLSEVLCDAFVEYIWGQGSILDSYYGDIKDEDLEAAWNILMAPEVNPVPVPPEPPTPLPLPDPQIAELQARVDALTAALRGIGQTAQDAVS